MKNDIIGLGFCGWDYVCLVPEIPVDHKVEIIQNLSQGGGPAATAIYTAQRLGASTAFIGAVGDDENGHYILQEFYEMGIDTTGIIQRKTAVSPTAHCWVEQQKGKRSIAWSRGTVAPLRPEELNLDLLYSGRILHLDGHHTEAAVYAADLAAKKGITVCLDAGTILENIEILVDRADIVIASEWFAKTFTGHTDLEIALKNLHASRACWTVVTCGENGSIGYDGRQFFKVPAFVIQAIDTTGAGDVFHGAFLYSYLKGGDLPANMRFASAAAALKCRQLGGRTGIPTRTNLETFLHEQTKK